MKRHLARIVTLTAVLLISSLALLEAPVQAAEAPEEPGKAMFLSMKCNLCHAVSSAGIEAKIKAAAMQGPDLKGVGQRHSMETLTSFILQEAEIDGKQHKKKWAGTDEELQKLLAWLTEQK